MYFSKYNLFVPLTSIPGKTVLNNLYHGSAMLLSDAVAKELNQRANDNTIESMGHEEIRALKESRFVYDSKAQEDELIRQDFLEFQNTMVGTNAMRQYVIILSYGCNFNCGYCFQKGLHGGKLMTQAKLSKVLETIQQMDREVLKKRRTLGLPDNVMNKPAAVNIAGGEVLQLGKEHFDRFQETLVFCENEGLAYTITTNGYHLKEYVPEMLKREIRPGSIQVTIDGPEKEHNQRRPHAMNADSFARITSGIDAALDAKLHINLRINVDHTNVNTISELTDFIDEKGWFHNTLITPYLAPVTNHSDKLESSDQLHVAKDLLGILLEKAQNDQRILDLYKMTSFHGFGFVRSCVMEKETPTPSFCRCEALQGQMVFDPAGDVYACFESAGHQNARIGKYYPELDLSHDKLREWHRFTTITNPYCSSCKYVFVCAGGCPWNAMRSGKPECANIAREIKQSWNHYAKLALQ